LRGYKKPEHLRVVSLNEKAPEVGAR